MRHVYILLFIIFICEKSTGQKKNYSTSEFYVFKNELGINFTNVLGNVLSLNPNNANSPYGLTYRRHFGKWSFRSALSILIDNLNENDFSDGSFIERKLNTLNTNTRIGLERHLVLSKKMMFSYGVDALIGFGKERSEINQFASSSSSFISDEYIYGFGAGPMIRLEFKISDRLFLSTESSLYANYNVKTESITINGFTSDEPRKSNSRLALELPQSLFFNISF